MEEIIAPTEDCPWRKKVLCGEVHDDNAYAVGGVAGHAGLFSSVRDIHQLLACLNSCLRGSDSFLPQSIDPGVSLKGRIREKFYLCTGLGYAVGK